MDLSYVIIFLVYTLVCVSFGIVGLKVVQLLKARKKQK